MRRIWCILALIVVLTASCQRKVLLEPEHHHGDEVLVEIDATVKANVNIDVESAELYSSILSQARTITIIAYPQDENGLFGVHTLKGLEGNIWLIPGRYNLMVYTSDFYELDGVFYRGQEDYKTLEAYTNQAKVSSKGANNVKSYVIDDPDPLFAHLYENFTVEEGVNRFESGLEPRSYRYWFEVEVDGLDYITSAYMEIAGMYTTVFLADGSHREDEHAIQKAEATLHKDENKIKGEFFSFGPHQDSSVKNSMVLTFVNGRTIKVELDDLTPKIKTLTHGGKIEIEQKIVINVDDTGAGFSPEVKDWGDEEEVVIPI